jgi:hypothetical protein
MKRIACAVVWFGGMATGCLTGGLLHAVARYDVAPISPRAGWDPGFEHQASASFATGCF